MNFDKAFNRTVLFEGGYSNDSLDRGGETVFGVSRRHHPDWIGWRVVENHFAQGGTVERLDDNRQLIDHAKALYKAEYWDRLKLDQVLAVAVSCEVFDTAVNCGTKIGALFLQQAANLVGRSNPLVEDGVVGPKTIDHVNRTAAEFPAAMLKALNGLQFEHYHAIIKARPIQRRFIRGWLRRVDFTEGEK